MNNAAAAAPTPPDETQCKEFSALALQTLFFHGERAKETYSGAQLSIGITPPL